MTGKVWWWVDVEEEAVMWRLGRTGSDPEAGEAKLLMAHFRGPAGELVLESPASVVPRPVGEEENRE